MIFDTHAHYDDTAFDEDREALLNSLQEHGIGMVIDVGSSLATTKAAIALSEQHDFIYAAAGVHPSETMELEEQPDGFDRLREMCSYKKVKAIGEIGLDYHYPDPERQIQQKWFRRQLNLARELHLPVSLHSRDAAMDTLQILQEEKAGEIGGVMHCYSYSPEQVSDYLKMGFCFGIGGVLTFTNAKKLKGAVAEMPLSQILLETDCPYLAPVPHRGERNSSLNLPLVITAIAEIKGVSEEEVIRVTQQNAERLFSI